MSDKLNKIAQLEKAIQERWGAQSVINPKSLWSEQDEADFQFQKSQESYQNSDKSIVSEVSGTITISRLITDKQSVCSKCGKYTLSNEDTLYLLKFGICYLCFCNNEFVYKCQGKIK